MTKNCILAMLAVLCLSFLITTPVAAKDYRAGSFDVWVDIQKDGSLVITETIKFHFNGGPFTYVFRNISRNGMDDITITDASMDGLVFPSGTGAGQVEIVDGDPVKITWHFAPTSNSTHVYVLRYRVQGAIRSGNADTLIWRIVPESHDYSIDGSAISITYPIDKYPLKAPTLDHTFQSITLDSGYRLTTGKMDTDESVVLTIQFASGSLVTQIPAWQSLQQQKTGQLGRAMPYGLGAALLAGLLGLVWVLLMGRSFRRETSDYLGAQQNYSIPPSSISAALAAHLTGSNTAFLGSLFDLLSRGVLQMEEGPKKWGSRTFGVLRHLIGAEALEPHEQVFLEALFKKAKNDRVELTDIASLAYNRKFSRALDQEMTTLGWRDAGRSARRSRFLVLAVLALTLGLAVLGAGLLLGGLSLMTNPLFVIIGAILVGVGIASIGVGLVGLVVAVLISTLTDEGMRQAAAWKSFTGYLRNLTRGRESNLSPDTFEHYLPYAAGFGIATEWAKHFQKMAGVPIPAWFQGIQSSVEDGSFAAILAAVTAADSSASAAASAGAGGASGGGASGAG